MIGSILSELKPLPASYLKVARRIEALESDDLIPVRLALAATFTADLLPPYLIVEGAVRGLKIASHIAPFNQLEQSLLAADSALHAFNPQVIAVAAELRDLAPPLAQAFLAQSPEDVEALLSAAIGRLEALIVGARATSAAPILVFNFAEPARLEAGLADPALVASQARAVEDANARLADLCQSQGGVHVFDYRRVVNELGTQRWYDRKLWYWSRTPFGTEGHMALARVMARTIRAALQPPCKCLVVDLDNTLWGGIIGEDRMNGIALGEDYPGNVYKDFQRALLSLKERGILLAIASKNNLQDAEQVFLEHPDCILKLEDFAAHQIHWNDKAGSIRAIAQELNIGTDAIAFFDDNPVERDWVRQALPEVKVIEVPKDPLQYLSALDESGVFDQLSISAEDRHRAQLYQVQREREALQANSANLADFLSGLNMTARIGYLDTSTRQRVAQLINKTNQFNLTTRRYSEGDLDRMVRDGAIVLWMRLSDRFGDNGLIAVAIAVPEAADDWRIDSFLMSCRVLGRQAETTLLAYLMSEIARRGGKRVIGEYLPSRKNGLVADFYASQGFEKQGEDGQTWIAKAREIPPPAGIAVEIGDAA